MGNTKITWTNKTWNPVTGCSKVSEGCKNCYAEGIAKRFWKDRKFTDVQCHTDRLGEPLKWKKPCMVFVNSMSDLFHDKVDFEFVNKVMNEMFFNDRHTYQILTKRPERMLQFFNETPYDELRTDLDNVWLGVTCENQKTADERIPLLLQTPAKVRFLSLEPLLGEIELEPVWLGGYESCSGYYPQQIHWVIVGCESGSNKRECKIEWIEFIVEQCKSANVPVFVKQLNINGKVVKDINEFPEYLRIQEYPL